VSDIASTLRRHWLEIVWGLFAAANVVIVVLLRHWETIPFHLVWVSLTLLYGFRVWRPRTTAVVLSVVMVATGTALTWTVVRGHEHFDEVMEVPLMAAMFLVMAWHAQRRQRAVEEMERSAQIERRVLERQREFVRDASHELRTPITVAIGHAELIQAGTRDVQVGRDVEVVLDELDRLSRLSERLLTLAGVDHPRFLSVRQFPIEELVVGTIDRWRPTAPRDWRATVRAVGTVRADRDRMETAIDALVENAVFATAEGGRIELSATGQDGTLVIEVSDDGRGIDPHGLPHVFERFSRREHDRARRSGGMGLGLAIVKAVVEAHGGTVEVVSEPGRGATFRMRLPGYVGSPVVREPVAVPDLR
jgi:signal transduction histidine kinase